MRKLSLAAVLLLIAPLSTGCGQSAAEADAQEPPTISYAGEVGEENDSDAESHGPTYASADNSGGYSSTYSSGYAYSDDEEFDEYAARDEAEQEVASDGYDYSYGCTQDCSGHEAGWAYQGQEGYGSYPSGNSRSFEEGRMAYDEAVDERVEEMRSEWESQQNDE